MEITSKHIKIQGAFELPLETELELGTDYLVALEGSITTRSESPNEDGTMSQMWRYKPAKGKLGAITGKSVTLKDVTRKSVRLRSMITNFLMLDYEISMDKLMKDPEKLKEFIESL